MTDVLIPIALLVNIVTLAAAISGLRSSRRSEGVSETRYDLLRDQQDYLELLREERQMLVQELKRESQERQQLIRLLEEVDPEIVEKLQLEQKDSSERKETLRQVQGSGREREERLTETHQNEE
jgi:biopolymer transport protein ExbB/TolQ